MAAGASLLARLEAHNSHDGPDLVVRADRVR
jgi:hypothetical protein